MTASDAEPSASTRETVGGWRRWGMAFLALWLIGVAWALATPRAGGPDEPSHVLRAASVVRGELVPASTAVDRGSYALVHVPASIAAVVIGPGSQSGTTDTPGQKPCYASKRQVTADCLPAPTTSSTRTVAVGSGAARYNPVYYALVGWPSLIAPNEVGVVLMRVVSAGLSAALLASAFASASTARRGRTAVLGVLVAATPGTMFLAGVVNPNGLEIAAAVGLWASGLRLVLADEETLAVGQRVLLRRVGVAASLLVLCRNLSPLWLVVVVVAVVGVGSWARLRRLARDRALWAWAAVVAVCSIAAVAWILLSGGTSVPGVRPREIGYLGALGRTFRQLDNRMVQIVGFFGWNDTPAPVVAWICWGVVGLGLIGLALRVGTARQRLVLVVVTLLGAVGGFFLEATQYHLLGLFWQTRYSMPVLVGAPVLAGLVVGTTASTERRWWPRLGWPAVALLVVAHVLCFLQALIRYAHGLRASLSPFGGPWAPPLGTATVLLVLALGLGLLVYAVRGVPLSRTASAEERPRGSAASA